MQDDNPVSGQFTHLTNTDGIFITLLTSQYSVLRGYVVQSYGYNLEWEFECSTTYLCSYRTQDFEDVDLVVAASGVRRRG